MSSEKILVLKVTFKETTKKIPLSNEDMTYDEFILMMQRVFKGLFTSTEPLSLKYLDDEKDWITLTDTDDLQFAISSSHNYLRVQIEKEVPALQVKPELVESFVVELRSLQDCLGSFCNKFLNLTPQVKESKQVEQQPGGPVSSHPYQKQVLESFDPIPAKNQENLASSYKGSQDEPQPHKEPYYQDINMQTRPPSGHSLTQQQRMPMYYSNQQRTPYLPQIHPSRGIQGLDQPPPPHNLPQRPPQMSSYGQSQVSPPRMPIPPMMSVPQRPDYNQGPMQISSADNPASSKIDSSSGYSHNYSTDMTAMLPPSSSGYNPGSMPPQQYRVPLLRHPLPSPMERPPYGYPPPSQAMSQNQPPQHDQYRLGPDNYSTPPH